MSLLAIIAGDNTDFNFEIGAALPNGVALTRGSSATKVAGVGSVDLALTDIARFDKYPTTGAGRGLLYEDTSSNLIKYSKNPSASTFRTDFVTSTAYFRGGCTAAVSTDITSLFSGSEIIKITEDISTGAHFLCSPAASSPAATEDRVFSVAVYAGTCSKFALTPKSGFLTANDYNVKFDLATGTVIGAQNLTNYGIVDYGNGWFIPWVVYNTTTSTSFRSVTIQTIDNSNAVSFLGTLRTFYMSMPQCETGTIVSSYMPSDVNIFTRSRDTLTIPLPYPKNRLTLTFDDNSTQVITGVTGGAYILPVNINRRWIKKIRVEDM